jgi:hypothetical protein
MKRWDQVINGDSLEYRYNDSIENSDWLISTYQYLELPFCLNVIFMKVDFSSCTFVTHIHTTSEDKYFLTLILLFLRRIPKTFFSLTLKLRFAVEIFL